MSVYEVNRLIYAMKMDPALAERFRADRDGLLAERDLTDEERDALTRLDYEALRLSGVVPNLLLRLSSIAGAPFAGAPGGPAGSAPKGRG